MPSDDLSKQLSIPALALPYELTAEIFIHCLPFHRRIRPYRRCIPLRLSQVCSQWREAALATPQLWSSIYIELTRSADGGASLDSDDTVPEPEDGLSMLFDGTEPEPEDRLSRLSDPESDPEYIHDILELWFARAAGYPLSITLLCDTRAVSVPSRIMALVAAHSGHWGRVELQVNADDFSTFNEIPGPFPRLRSLIIRPIGHALDLQTVNALREAPNLTAANLSLVSRLGALPGSLTALQTIYWHEVDDSGHSPIFEQLPQLRHLSTIVEYATHQRMIRMHGRGAPPVVLPTLQSLLIKDSPYLLDRLHTPALQFLGGRFHPTPLIAFLSRSARYLTHLSIDITIWYFGGGDAELADCLMVVPTLTTLDLVFRDYRARLPRYACLERADLLPRLQQLFITDGLHRGTTAPFLAVVRVRPALIHAELHMRPRHEHLRFAPPKQDVLRELEALVAHGKNIRITAPNYAWPLHSDDDRDVVDMPDYNIFTLGSYRFRSHFFSPFD
ncbi:hypothetical protein B0H11DRAFT_1803476 [Mycena galericulata]|nr:hypothetical protein B0H11DRAFT_1803476 [Mycena galericulata]